MDNESLSIFTTRQINNLIKIAISDAHRRRLQEELARRKKERLVWYIHEQRGRERARAEGRLK